MPRLQNRRARQAREAQDRQTRTLLLFFGFFFLVQTYLLPSTPPVAPQRSGETETETASPSSPAAGGFADHSAEQLAERARGLSEAAPPERFTRVPLATLGAELGFQQLELMNDGQIGTWEVLESQYRRRGEKGEDLGALPLATSLATQRTIEEQKERPLFLPPLLQLELNGQLSEGVFQLQGAAGEDGRLVTQMSAGGEGAVLQRRSPEGLQLTHRYQLNAAEHRVELEVEVENQSAAALSLRWRALLRGAQDPDGIKGGMFSMPTTLLESICQRSVDLERRGHDAIVSDAADPDEPTKFDDGISWGAVDTRYFMSGLSARRLNTSEELGERLLTRCAHQSGAEVSGAPLPSGWVAVGTALSSSPELLSPQARRSYRFNFFLGPKKLELLEEQRPSLASAIDFGWFSPICLPMLWILRAAFDLIPNWGIAIILLTILVKLLTFPLTVKQYRSMAKMKIVQPEMKALQERYRDDPQRLQAETLQLYRSHGVNPLSGCLPMFLMMPIYFALYRTIFSAVELYQADFALWIHDLSSPDPYFVFPLLLGLLFIIQMRLGSSATSGNPEMQKMMTRVMPVMMTLMMLFLPSGLVLYIIVNTVLGIFQQQWTQKISAQAA